MPRKGQRRTKPRATKDFEQKRRKVGKTKRVPENVTQVSFKSKSVVIPSQYQGGEQGATSHRKQSLHVLLTQTHHHNSTVRHDALVGLKDIFLSNPEFLLRNLPKLIEQVFPTLMDDARVVRQVSYALVKLVLSSVSSSVIGPFFGIIVAYLHCGLTHIKEGIRLDSVKLLGLCLEYCADLLICHTGSVLSTLIGLLSKQGTVSTHSTEKLGGLYGKVHPATCSTALDVNPNSSFARKSSQKSIFSLVLELLNSLLSRNSSQHTNDSKSLFDGGETFFGRLEKLAILLLESWVECSPADFFSSKTPSAEVFSLMETIVSTMSVLVKVLLTISDSLKSATRISKIFHDIIVHMMCHFPFGLSTSSSSCSTLFVMNFTFSEMIILLFKFLHSLGLQEKLEIVLNVLTYLGGLGLTDIKNIACSAQSLPVCSQVIVSIMPLIRLHYRNHVSSDVLKRLFRFFKEFYFSCHVHSRSKQLLTECLSRMFISELSNGCRSLMMAELLLPWLNSLFDMFHDLKNTCPEVSATVMDCIAVAAMHKNVAGVEEKILPFLSSLATFLGSLSEVTQRRVVELAWHLPQLQDTELAVLSKCISSTSLHVHVKQYLIQIVHHKQWGQGDLKNLSSYFSFMWTILLGCTSDEWRLTDAYNQLDRDWLPCVIINKSTFGAEYELQKTVCECLKASPVSSCVMTCLEMPVLQLKSWKSLPANSVCGVLLLASSLHSSQEEAVSIELQRWFAELCMSCLVLTGEDENTSQQLILQHVLQLLAGWSDVLELVLDLFRNIMRETSDVLCVKGLLRMLCCGDLYSILWRSRTTLSLCLEDVAAFLPVDTPVGISRELVVARKKFLSSED